MLSSLPTFKDQTNDAAAIIASPRTTITTTTPPPAAVSTIYVLGLTSSSQTQSSITNSGEQEAAFSSFPPSAIGIHIPFAEDVTPIPDETSRQISNEEKLRLEKEKLELQLELRQRDLELEQQRVANLQLTLQHQQQQQQTTTSNTNNNQQQQQQQQPAASANNNNNHGGSSFCSKKHWRIGVGIAIFLAVVSAVVLVAVLCGSGNCGTGGPTPNERSLPTPNQQTPQPVPPQTTTPPMSNTSSTTRANLIVSFVNNITLSGRILEYPPSNTALPEERALQWLIEVDTIETTVPLSNTEVSLRQRYALATIWYQTPTPFGSNDNDFVTTWTVPNITECEWQGVQCDDNNRQVIIRLRLGNDNVGGYIPNDIGLLTALTRLDLNDNWLIGTIPTTISMLTALQGLILRGNQLTGTIPSALGNVLTALTELTLSYNQLKGTIPESFGNLTALDTLGLRGNQLTGTIPSSLTTLTALTEFWLYENQLIGTMPFCGQLLIQQTFQILITDCDEVNCTCCTHCCPTPQAKITVYFPC